MNQPFIKILILSSIFFLITTQSYGSCPCFNRFYLYSIFYSEKNSYFCEVRADGRDNEDNQIISIVSFPTNGEHSASNYGAVRSNSERCELLIDNQVISEDYTRYTQKISCDKEILKTCQALNAKVPMWPDGDHYEFEIDKE